MSDSNKKTETTATEKKTRKPRAVRAGITRVMVNLSDAHYARLAAHAAEEEREPGAQLSLLIRRNFDSLVPEKAQEHQYHEAFNS